MSTPTNFVLGEPAEQITLSAHMSYQMTDSPDLSSINALKWLPVQGNSLNLGYTQKNLWLKISLVNQTDIPDWILTLNDPLLDQVDLFLNNQLVEQFGEEADMRLRSFPYRYPAARVHFSWGTNELLIRVRSNDPVQPQVNLWQEAALKDRLAWEQIVLAFYLGALLSIAVYNLFLFFFSKEPSYFNYVAWIVLTGLTNLSFLGLFRLTLFVDHPWLAQRSLVCVTVLATVFGSLFILQFLNIKQYSKPLINIYKLYLILSMLLMPAAFLVDQYHFVTLGAVTNIALFPILALAAGIVALIYGNENARYFLIAWSFFLVGLMVRVFTASGTLPVNSFTIHGVQIGTFVEFILLAIALAHRLKRIEREKQEIQTKANQELNLLNESLIKASSAKDQFLSKISHELRTPINGVMGMLNLLEKQSFNSEGNMQLKNAIFSTKQIRSVIEKLLYLSESYNNDLHFDDEWFELTELIQKVISEGRSQSGIQSENFYFRINEDRPLFLFGKRNALKYSLIELIGNAYKFSDNNRVFLEVDVDYKNEIATCIFKIFDIGNPFSLKKTGLEFAPFNQADNSNHRQYGGLGIGLHIVHYLSKQSHFDFEVCNLEPTECRNEVLRFLTKETSPEQQRRIVKACLKLSWPYARKHQRSENKLVQPTRHLVLIVEDNPVNLLLLNKVVNSFGFETITANNGQDALEKVKEAENPPTFVFMDCQMPIMDGFEATQHIRKILPKIPIVAVTANTTQNDKQHCIAVGMNEIITKPIDGTDIQNSLQKWLA